MSDTGSATPPQSSDDLGRQSHTDNSVPAPSIRDITSVDVDQLDGDSIERLQRVLRRLHEGCYDDDDDDEVMNAQMTSACDQASG